MDHITNNAEFVAVKGEIAEIQHLIDSAYTAESIALETVLQDSAGVIESKISELIGAYLPKTDNEIKYRVIGNHPKTLRVNISIGYYTTIQISHDGSDNYYSFLPTMNYDTTATDAKYVAEVMTFIQKCLELQENGKFDDISDCIRKEVYQIAGKTDIKALNDNIDNLHAMINACKRQQGAVYTRYNNDGENCGTFILRSDIKQNSKTKIEYLSQGESFITPGVKYVDWDKLAYRHGSRFYAKFVTFDPEYTI